MMTSLENKIKPSYSGTKLWKCVWEIRGRVKVDHVNAHQKVPVMIQKETEMLGQII